LASEDGRKRVLKNLKAKYHVLKIKPLPKYITTINYEIIYLSMNISVRKLVSQTRS
jgi:hypothetical protein